MIFLRCLVGIKTKMTVTGATSLLILFRAKIEDAVGLVPGMGAEEKLKAVQFWNVVSEKLQEIVNNSAADINAFALKMNEEHVDKLSLEIGTESSSSLTTDSNMCTSGFINSSSNYTVCSGADSEFGTPDIHNGQVVQYLSSENTLPHITSTSLSKHLSDNISDDVALEGIANSSIPSKHANAIEQFPTIQTDSKSDSVLLSHLTDAPSDTLTKHSLLSNSTVVLQPEVDCGSSSSTVSKSICPTPKKERSKRPNCKRTRNNKTSTLNTKSKKINNNTKLLESHSEKTGCSQRKVTKSSRSKDGTDEESFNINCDHTVANSTKSKTELDSERTLYKNMSENDESIPLSQISLDGSIETNCSNGTPDNPVSGNDVGKTSDHLLDIGDEDSCEKEGGEWPNSNKPHACSECDSKFATRGNLIVHLRSHTGERPYPCPQCPARFSTMGNLKRHIKTHSGEKPWKCSQCVACFTEKKSLKVHMRKHTGEKPYQCSICTKKFSQTGILQTHMAMHLDQKAHLCEHCGKSFRQKSQLRLHMLRHEGVKKYCCDACPARFLTKGDLERHTRVHTGERPFVCELCGKTFTRQQSLNEHMNRHYGLKPYECKYCHKSFSEMSACYKHIKVHERQQLEDSSGKITENGTQQTTTSSDPEIQFSSSDVVNHVIVGSHEYEELPPQKFTVILHNNSESVEVMNGVSVENEDLKNSYVITSSSESTRMDISTQISNFAAINLLANASTHQENF